MAYVDALNHDEFKELTPSLSVDESLGQHLYVYIIVSGTTFSSNATGRFFYLRAYPIAQNTISDSTRVMWGLGLRTH